MGLGRLAGLASAGLVAMAAAADDLLFYDNMTYLEYTQATTVLGFSGIIDASLLSSHRLLTAWRYQLILPPLTSGIA